MKRERKLKRGLKDISPLFAKKKSTLKASHPAPQKRVIKEEAEEPKSIFPEKKTFVKIPASTGVQCLSVYSPDGPEDSLFIETYLASQLISEDQSCYVLSMDGASDASFNSNSSAMQSESLKHVTISWQQLDQIFSEPTSLFHQSGESQFPIIFLDFHLMRVPGYQKVMTLLDKWILHIQPTLESVMECYKLIKAALTLNPRLEFYVLFDGTPQEKKGIELFEAFSDLVSRRLGVQLVWLGTFSMKKGQNPIVSDLALDHLFLESMVFEDSLEKRSLAGISEESLNMSLKVAM